MPTKKNQHPGRAAARRAATTASTRSSRSPTPTTPAAPDARRRRQRRAAPDRLRSACTPTWASSRPCTTRASWPSSRASAIRTRIARTSAAWTSGTRPSPETFERSGWLGRYVAACQCAQDNALPAISVGDQLNTHVLDRHDAGARRRQHRRVLVPDRHQVQERPHLPDADAAEHLQPGRQLVGAREPDPARHAAGAGGLGRAAEGGRERTSRPSVPGQQRPGQPAQDWSRR